MGHEASPELEATMAEGGGNQGEVEIEVKMASAKNQEDSAISPRSGAGIVSVEANKASLTLLETEARMLSEKARVDHAIRLKSKAGMEPIRAKEVSSTPT